MRILFVKKQNFESLAAAVEKQFMPLYESMQRFADELDTKTAGIRRTTDRITKDIAQTTAGFVSVDRHQSTTIMLSIPLTIRRDTLPESPIKRTESFWQRLLINILSRGLVDLLFNFWKKGEDLLHDLQEWIFWE